MLITHKTTIQEKMFGKPHYQAFEEFFQHPIWVLSDSNGKPIQTCGKNAKCNDPQTWECFEKIISSYEKDYLPAICLHSELRLIFIDLDHVRNANSGDLLPWAKNLVEKTKSYTEISRSGTGVHIFLRGNPPELENEALRFKAKNIQGTNSDIEIYYEKKFATLTGDVLLDLPIREVSDEEMISIYRQFFPASESPYFCSNAFTTSPPMEDEQILKRARSSKSCDKFKRLYDDADLGESEDRSALDLSLANFLAFYTQNIEQIKRLMMGSSLYRSKWEREDYLDRTIDTALSGLNKTFQQPKQHASKEPIPIKTTTTTTGEPFPVDCLPPLLRDMAKEMQIVSKTPLELCCAAVLSAASVATKGTVKVFEKETLSHFTCFFFMIIAESGERKSNVLKTAFAPITQHQDEDKVRYLDDLRSYKARQKAAKDEERKILKGKIPTEEKAQQLEIIEKELESYKPKPYRYITDNFTDPALFKLLEENNGSFAVMTLDGGNVLDYIRGNGHGTDGSLNDALLLKATWGDSISRDRIGNTPDGEHLFIKEPACHVTIIVQPDRCRDFLSDTRLRGSGLIARILPILCTSTIGTRFESEDDPVYNQEVVTPYHKLISNLFKKESITEVYLDEDAARARRDFFNEIEKEMARGNSLEDLRDIGSKITTQVTRLAALFKVCSSTDNPERAQIDKRTWYQAEAVGRWFFDQAAHLQRTDYDEQVLISAKKISEKILKSSLATNENKKIFAKREFQQQFKHDLRTVSGKCFTDDVLSTLASYRWISEVPDTKSQKYVVNKSEVK
ncbi:MAG: DUF3987 domain-containing protein [Chlamydiales bacterium]|nr:DUF3987 domain-containing protein [Chlamydiales bacterium]